MVGDWIVQWNEFYEVDPESASSIGGIRNDRNAKVAQFDKRLANDSTMIDRS